MGIVITVDLAASSPAEIARAAKFMLEFAGYQDPSVAQSADNAQGLVGAASGSMLQHPMGSLGEEVHGHDAFSDAEDRNNHQRTDLGAVPETAAAFAPPVPTATPAPAPATLPPPPAGIEVDAQGVPWDVRIHAGSRAKIADGTWRQKRNLDPEVYKQVMDELRHTMGVERRAPQPPAPPAPQQVFAAVPPVPAVAPPAPDATDGWPAATPGNLVVPPATATIPVPQMVANVAVPPVPFAGNAAPPAPPVSSTPIAPVSAGAAMGASRSSAPTFPDLMKRITAGFAGGTIKQPDIQRAVQKVGLTALPMLASRPDLVGDVATELGIAL